MERSEETVARSTNEPEPQSSPLVRNYRRPNDRGVAAAGVEAESEQSGIIMANHYSRPPQLSSCHLMELPVKPPL